MGTVAFTPDGRRIAAAGSGGVTVFDGETGTELLVLRSPDLRWPWRIAFNADGSMLATQAPGSVGEPGIVRVLALDIDDLLHIARRAVPRALTDEECRQYLHVDRCVRA